MPYIDRNDNHRHRLPMPRRLPDIPHAHLQRANRCGAAIEGPFKKRIHGRQWRALVRYMALTVVLMAIAGHVFF